MNFLIEATRADGSRVQRLLVIRCSDHHDRLILLKAIHFCQDLIECGSARAALTLACASLARQYTVDLVDEDEAGLLFTRLSEKLLDASRAHAHEHLIEVGPRAENEIAPGFSRDRPCQQGFAGAWLSKQHDSLEELGALVLVKLWILDNLDDVLYLVFDLIDAFDIIQTLFDRRGLLYIELVHLRHTVLKNGLHEVEAKAP